MQWKNTDKNLKNLIFKYLSKQDKIERKYYFTTLKTSILHMFLQNHNTITNLNNNNKIL